MAYLVYCLVFLPLRPDEIIAYTFSKANDLVYGKLSGNFRQLP